MDFLNKPKINKVITVKNLYYEKSSIIWNGGGITEINK